MVQKAGSDGVGDGVVAVVAEALAVASAQEVVALAVDAVVGVEGEEA